MVESIVSLRSTLKVAMREHSKLTAELAKETLEDASGVSSVDINVNLEGLANQMESLQKQLKSKEDLLASDGKAGKKKLESLKKSRYLQSLVSAKAFKS